LQENRRIATRRLRSAVGGARRLTVVARFGGNAALGPRTKTFHVRVRG